MINYDAVFALETIVEVGSFARAANRLHISQSAISQRIQNLEELLGELVLVREQPPRLTEFGVKLVQHYKEVQQLQAQHGLIKNKESVQKKIISIAVNADTLSTWLFSALNNFILRQQTSLEIIVEDEDHSLNLLKKGLVSGVISSSAKSIKGCDAIELGQMLYCCLATKDFIKRFKKKGKSLAEFLAEAPVINFGRKDDMQSEYLKKNFPKIKRTGLDYYLGSNSAYLEAILNSWGWGLVPKIQAENFIKSGKLVEIAPKFQDKTSLYWHQWHAKSEIARDLCNAIVKGSKSFLK